MLSGCQTPVAVFPKFPNVPDEIMQLCGDLKDIPEGTEKLSEVISVVAENYGKYHECRLKVATWREWYMLQKGIYDREWK